MVKLNWVEESAIYLIVLIVMVFVGGYFSKVIDFGSWFWLIVWFVLYFGISGILVKVIRGKDIKEKEDKNFKRWWKKQKTWEKVIIILLWVVIVIGVISWSSDSSNSSNPPTQTTAQTSLSNQVKTSDYSGNCPIGYILGLDGLCHQTCVDSNHYCQNGGVCFNNQCVTCPSGLIPGQDGQCHETCGSPNTYCQNPDEQYCLNNQCVICPSGYVLRTDGNCYPS